MRTNGSATIRELGSLKAKARISTKHGMPNNTSSCRRRQGGGQGWEVGQWGGPGGTVAAPVALSAHLCIKWLDFEFFARPHGALAAWVVGWRLLKSTAARGALAGLRRQRQAPPLPAAGPRPTADARQRELLLRARNLEQGTGGCRRLHPEARRRRHGLVRFAEQRLSAPAGSVGHRGRQAGVFPKCPARLDRNEEHALS